MAQTVLPRPDAREMAPVHAAGTKGVPMIVVQDLHKRYGETRAVDGITFEVAEGEIFALLGPNGAGKTTLISIVCGIVNASAGTVRATGTTSSRITAPRARRSASSRRN